MIIFLFQIITDEGTILVALAEEDAANQV